MKKLRMGIIGTGMAFEKLHHPAYEMLSDKYEIAALCDTDRFKTDKWIRTLGLTQEDSYDDYNDMMKRTDIDAFDIMVPIELNFTVTKDVVKAGKPIICEKPLGSNFREIEEARQLSKSSGVPIMIAENYRHNEEIIMIRDMVDQAKIGEVHYFIWNRFLDTPKQIPTAKFPAREWRQHPEFPGGVILDTGVHDMAALRYIFKEIRDVSAFGNSQPQDFAPYSALTAIISFKSGVVGNYTFYSAGKEELKPLTGLRIYGSAGMIYLEERDSGQVKVISGGGKTEVFPYKVQRGYYNELLNFYNAFMGTEKIKVTPEVEYGDVHLLLSILKSAVEKRIIKADEAAVKIPAAIV